MELLEDENIISYGKKCGHCIRNMLLLYEYKWTCFSCAYKVIKRKHELTNIQRKKNKL